MEKKVNFKALAGLFIFAVAAMASNMTMGLLGSIGQTYAENYGVGATTVQSILVGPALIATIYAFVVSGLNKKIPAKILLIIGQVGLLLYGLIFWLLGGKVPISMLIIASGFVGLNQGSMNTLIGLMLVDIVPDEKQRPNFFAYISTVMNVGGVIITSLGGIIADKTGSWNSAYVLFLYYVAAILLELILIPNRSPEGAVAPSQGGEKVKASVGAPVWILSGHYFFFFLFLYVFGTNCAGFIMSHGLGGNSEAGFAASTVTIGGIIAGAAYPFYSKIFGKALVPVLMAISTVGLAIPVFIQTSTIGIYAAGIMCGFAMMGANPYIVGAHMPKIAPGPAYGTAMSIFAGFMNFGMVVAIYVIAFLTKLVCGDPDNIDKKFLVAMVGMLITTILSIPIYLAKDKAN